MSITDMTARDEKILELRIKQFVSDFAPGDPRLNSYFVATLHMIVRQATLDGGKAATDALLGHMHTCTQGWLLDMTGKK